MTGASASGPAPERMRVPARAVLATYLRLLAVQGSWNYETLLGNGIAFCAEPILRLLPEDRYRAAMVREARYFNAHPYLAAVAVGALARAELDGADPARIERFRTALCGPLGSVGDQLVWAGWLPLCSLAGIGAFALGAGPLTTLFIFLGAYNAGHLALRAWGLHAGLARGLDIAPALAAPLLRRGPAILARVGAITAGVVLPIALERIIGPGRVVAGAVAAGAVAGAIALARTHTRAQGWRVALLFLAAYVLYSVVR